MSFPVLCHWTFKEDNDYVNNDNWQYLLILIILNI